MGGDEVPQLLHHSVDQLLFVALVLSELGENVVLPARVLHPTGKKQRSINRFD